MNLELMLDSLPRMLGGAWVTLQLVTLALALGFVLAVLLALMRLSASRIASGLAYGYTFVFRGTPLLVQMFIIYYGTAQFEWVRDSILWPILREPFWCAILALTLNTAAYTSEIIRGGIQSVPLGQIEAARACGMPPALLFRRITFPVALRQALPAYGNEIILMVKGSSLASVITIMEITGISRQIISRTFALGEIFLIACAIYLTINFAAAWAIKRLEWRLTPYLRPRM